jgi:hypothetical protein
MNGLETQEVGNKERLAEAAEPCEGEILGMNTAREQALMDKAALDEGATKEEMLPKLSAAEFRAYNSKAEHMEYFVSPRFVSACCGWLLCLVFGWLRCAR